MSKTFSSPTFRNQFNIILDWAADNTLAVTLDCDRLRGPDLLWLCTLHDVRDTPVLSGRGSTAEVAVERLYTQVLPLIQGYSEA